MPIDLMNLAKNALGGGLMDQLAGDLNESPEVTRSACLLYTSDAADE